MPGGGNYGQTPQQQQPTASPDGMPVFYLYCRSGAGKPCARANLKPERGQRGRLTGRLPRCAQVVPRIGNEGRRPVEGSHQRVAQQPLRQGAALRSRSSVSLSRSWLLFVRCRRNPSIARARA
eukprot:5997262-Prymnesium_polylepis.1